MGLKISVITVCYNMAEYIEKTILSVLSQDYPDLEYIIIDGDSTDGTKDIIEKYHDRIACYVSEPDNGMYDAIAKGFKMATGDVLAWLNADDVYFPWTLSTVNKVFTEFPETQWLGGKYAFMNEYGMLTEIYPKTSIRSRSDIANGWCREGILGPLQQESMFWRRELYTASGGLNISYRYAGDFELWMRFARFSELAKIDLPLAAFRKRNSSLSKAGKDKYQKEVELAISDKRHSPNVLWNIFGHSKIMIQLLRLLRFRKGTIFHYSLKTHELKKTEMVCSAGNHDVQSLLLYR
ncbi:MAG: glycosyltransferase [Bacteroidales bacterium]|nr:glycosyltransferase [Bacteroidales bacterium]